MRNRECVSPSVLHAAPSHNAHHNQPTGRTDAHKGRPVHSVTHGNISLPTSLSAGACCVWHSSVGQHPHRSSAPTFSL